MISTRDLIGDTITCIRDECYSMRRKYETSLVSSYGMLDKCVLDLYASVKIRMAVSDQALSDIKDKQL